MDEVRSAGSPAVALSQFEKAGFCAGVVLGISEMLTAPFACIPNSVPAEQIVQAVVNFADRQPETMKDNFGLLVGAALSVAWPCPKDKWSEREKLTSGLDVNLRKSVLQSRSTRDKDLNSRLQSEKTGCSCPTP
jgi:hypothetical protein